MHLSPKVLEAESICLNCGEIVSLQVEFNHALIEPATCAKCGKPMTLEEVRHGFVRRDREKSTIAEAVGVLESWKHKILVSFAPAFPIFFFILFKSKNHGLEVVFIGSALVCIPLIMVFVKTQQLLERLCLVADNPEILEIRLKLQQRRRDTIMAILTIAAGLLGCYLIS